MKKILILCACVMVVCLIVYPVFAQDTDADGIPDGVDNCPTTPNGPSSGTCFGGYAGEECVGDDDCQSPATCSFFGWCMYATLGASCMSNSDCQSGEICSLAQEDNYPPDGNGCGDVCDCEGNFDGDEGVGGGDASTILTDFERTDCTNDNPCNGDFDCDGDVDLDDGVVFVGDFGRSLFFRPCPSCVTEPWCVYDKDEDGIPDGIDNCEETANGPDGGTCIAGESHYIARPCMDDSECGIDGFCTMNQEDTDDDGIGDACEICEGDLSCDDKCDAIDVEIFLEHFGRSQFNRPCTNQDQCPGDFFCDQDVDAEDVPEFLECLGRNPFNNPCLPCVFGPWCIYP